MGAGTGAAGGHCAQRKLAPNVSEASKIFFMRSFLVLENQVEATNIFNKHEASLRIQASRRSTARTADLDV